MKLKDQTYNLYTSILNEELVPAMGCTEPIAIAYCSSIMRHVLGSIPTKVVIIVSKNIIKNVKSVTVPNTNGMHGIESAMGIGVLAGDYSKKLEVIANATKSQIAALPSFLENTNIKVKCANNNHALYIKIIGYFKDDISSCEIMDNHTHVTKVTLNNKTLYEDNTIIKNESKPKFDYSLLNVKDIIKYADICDLNDVSFTLERQIAYNMAIANEGLNKPYGANIGKTLMKHANSDVLTYVKAMAASGSDARMNGCELPVIINSGSGNQGLTCSVPVIAYANKIKANHDKLLRSLIVSNLCTIHIKENIGTLSAYCGVVIAGSCSGAGIAYLNNGSYLDVSNTIINALAMASGIVCDGAKPSCAGKISLSVEAGLLGYAMTKDNNNFYDGDGIVKDGVEKTISAVGLLARDGMKETDEKIIDIMISDC